MAFSSAISYITVNKVKEYYTALRQSMRPFTTFSDHIVLEEVAPNLGSLEGEVAQPNPTPKEQTPMRPPTPPAAALSNKAAAPAVGHEHFSWIEVHPSHPVASVGTFP